MSVQLFELETTKSVGCFADRRCFCRNRPRKILGFPFLISWRRCERMIRINIGTILEGKCTHGYPSRTIRHKSDRFLKSGEVKAHKATHYYNFHKAWQNQRWRNAGDFLFRRSFPSNLCQSRRRQCCSSCCYLFAAAAPSKEATTKENREV